MYSPRRPDAAAYCSHGCLMHQECMDGVVVLVEDPSRTYPEPGNRAVATGL